MEPPAVVLDLGVVVAAAFNMQLGENFRGGRRLAVRESVF